jgi:hypothetical protein
MACGCNKNKLGNKTNPARGGLVARQNAPQTNPPNPVRTRNSGVVPTQKLNKNGVMADQKRIQQIRREAILKNLGKKRR